MSDSLDSSIKKLHKVYLDVTHHVVIAPKEPMSSKVITSRPHTRVEVRYLAEQLESR